VRAEVPIIAANVSVEREGSVISSSFVFNSFYSTFFPFFRRAFLTVDRRMEALPKKIRSDEVNVLNAATLRTFNEGIVCEILSEWLSVRVR